MTPGYPRLSRQAATEAALDRTGDAEVADDMTIPAVTATLTEIGRPNLVGHLQPLPVLGLAGAPPEQHQL